MITESVIASRSLGREMPFSLHLPDQSPPVGGWPLLVLLHGRGRTHRTVADHPACRPAVEALPMAVLFPNGEDGWYYDAPDQPGHQYQSLIRELMGHVLDVQPITSDPSRTGIMGWSMGAYGAVRFAETFPDEIAAVAAIIGLLDFPNPDLPRDRNYKSVPAVFGTDRAVWRELNPLTHVGRLRGKRIQIVAAIDAFDILMNRHFHAALEAAGIPHEYVEVSGGHEWSVVERALPGVFGFMTRALNGRE